MQLELWATLHGQGGMADLADDGNLLLMALLTSLMIIKYDADGAT